MIKKLSIIIPAYNEGRTIHLILDKIKTVNLLNDIEKEVIIVNDCSSDNTEEAIQNYINDNEYLNIQNKQIKPNQKFISYLNNKSTFYSFIKPRSQVVFKKIDYVCSNFVIIFFYFEIIFFI